jgi:hypothetical protein
LIKRAICSFTAIYCGEENHSQLKFFHGCRKRTLDNYYNVTGRLQYRLTHMFFNDCGAENIRIVYYLYLKNYDVILCTVNSSHAIHLQFDISANAFEIREVYNPKCIV